MNVVVVTPSWPQDGNPNGIVTYYTNLIPALIDLGHTVHIVAFRSSDHGDNVQVIDYQASMWERVWCKLNSIGDIGYTQYYLGAQGIIGAIEKIAKKQAVDIVQMEDSFGWHKRVQKHFSFPVVMRLHGPYFLNTFEEKPASETKFRIKREEKAFLAAKFITSPSASVLRKTQVKYGDAWEVADVIANSIHMPPKEKRWDVGQVLNGQILFVGRFDNHKGADVMLHAFFKLKKQLPNVTLVFIGPDKGLEEEGEKLDIKAFLKKYDYKMNDGVKYLGKQSKQVIDDYRSKSHITVVSSRYETFGNVALEAIAYGSPLVCSDAGALPDIIENEASGLLFESGNIEMLVEKMYRLLSSNQESLQLSSGGVARVAQAFSTSSAAISTIEAFEKVLSLSKV